MKSKIIYYWCNLNLSVRIWILFSSISLVSLIVLGVFNYHTFTISAQKSINEFSRQITGELFTSVSANVEKVNSSLMIIANNTSVQNILLKEDEAIYKTYHTDNTTIEELMRSVVASNSYIDSIYIYPEYRNNLFAVLGEKEDNRFTFIIDNMDDENKQYFYDDALNYQSELRWFPPDENDELNTFTITQQIYSNKNEFLGMLVAYVNVRIIDETCNSYLQSDYDILFTDLEGMYMYAPGNEENLIGSQDLNFHFYSEQTGSFISEVGNEKKFVVYNKSNSEDWIISVMAPYGSITSGATSIFWNTIIITFITFLVILLMAKLVANSVVKPLETLKNIMQNNTNADVSVRFNTKYKDEIGQLGNCFNEMMGRLEETEKLKELESKQKVQAQITALEEQINPHFLSNTLASIYWLAIAEKNTAIANMASGLSKFFKLGLNNGKVFSTVTKEVEHAELYLTIQKYRFKDKLEYSFNMDNEVKQYSTMKFILQPIIENAISHGFGKTHHTGKIDINVYKLDDFLVYEISDNGAGIDCKDSCNDEDFIFVKGYGLRNIRERLKLYYDDCASISYKSVPFNKTVFKVKIPLNVECE